MNYTALLGKVEEYVIRYTQEHEQPNLSYHNLDHLRRVAAFASDIAQHYQLPKNEYFAVMVSAWFHDLGYFVDNHSKGHEERGTKIAIDFLKAQQVEDSIVAQVRACILATQMPQRPSTLLEQIVCDADLSHLGSKDFATYDKLLHDEIEEVTGIEIGKKTWRNGTIKLFETHHYHTDYCQQVLESQKQKNLAKLIEKQMGKKGGKKHKEEEVPSEVLLKKWEESVLADPEKAKKKKQERGADTMFRITSSNNQRLSTQADSKAHIMIQVNSLIISVILTFLLRKIENHPNIAIPAFIMMTVNLVTIIFSILATRPNIPTGIFTSKDLKNKDVNLLFFGNFYKMSLKDYSEGMQQVIDDNDFLYNSLIRDVYFQGVALGKKYRLLRLSYNVFMFGLVVSVLAFVLGVTVFATK